MGKSADEMKDGNENRIQEIEDSINRTEAEMADTITKIQHRLSPEHLKDQAIAKIKDVAGRGMEKFQGTVKKSPGPFIAAAAGLTFLLLRRKKKQRLSEQQEGMPLKTAAPSVIEAGEPGMRPPEMGVGRQQTSGSTLASATETTKAGAGRIATMAEEHPLMLGLAGIVVGVILGSVIPVSRREREIVGEARENLIRRAKEAGRETMQRVQGLTGTARSEARVQTEPTIK